MIVDISVLAHQKAFITSKSLSTGLAAGYGSGKSFAAVLKTLIKKMQYPHVKVAYYLPTYPLIRDIAFDKFPELCNLLGIKYKLNKSNKELIIKDYGTIIFRNMSEPEFIVGYEVGYSLIDECDILPMAKMASAFKHIIARNRASLGDGTHNNIDVVGTPEGFRWFYDRFVTNTSDNYHLIQARTTDNPYLPDGYIDTLKEDYDPKMLEQYLEGKFVNVNGSAVYHQFDRDKHVVGDREVNKDYPLIITWDFNIDPYNAVFLIQVINNKVYVIDNAIKTNASVVDTLTYLKDKFAHLGDYLYKATTYGDATGRARSQGTARTNYDLIEEAGFTNLRIKRSNPRVQDRVNTVNSMFKNGLGETKLYICKKNKELINDFEQMSYDDKGIVDKSNLTISHASDSVGYYIASEHAIIKQKELRLQSY